MSECNEWAVRLQAIAQNGLARACNEHDTDRFLAVQRVAAEMMSRRSGAPVEQVLDLFARQSGDATPKVDVRGIVSWGSQLLFVRERSDGLWALPGGWADPGESPVQAIEREISEEAGLTIRATRLLGVYDPTRRGAPPYPFAYYKLFFACEPVAALSPGVALTGGHEVTDVRFFPRDELPPLSLHRVLAGEIADALAHVDDPAMPVTVD